MAGKQKEKRATSTRVAENLKDLRNRRGLSYAELSRRLDRLGHPILDTGLMKIEKGDRRVDVDDLVALAAALDVNPSALLLPRVIDSPEVEITPMLNANPWVAWAWADGQMPLFGSYLVDDGRAVENDDLDEMRDFLLHSRPQGDEPEWPEAIKTLQNLIINTRALLYSGDDQSKWAPRVVGVKRGLGRLIRQVEDLLKPYPIEKTWYAEQAAEADKVLATLMELGAAQYTQVSRRAKDES